jgi:hypothetical protein
MPDRISVIIVMCALTFFSIASAPISAADYAGKKPGSAQSLGATEKMPVYSPLPSPGNKVPLGDGYYLQYGFDKKPKLGTVIMKVEIFTKEGRKDTGFEVKADAGMPSMRGAHETGERPFQLSRKGDYLLPINIVMPGDWEIRLSVLRTGKVIFRGRYNFDI